MLPVAIAMVGTRARVPTVGFLGWFGPRGLASIVFAVIVVEESNLPHEHLIVLAIYLTVGLSVFAHGLSAAPLAARYARWYERTRTTRPRRWKAQGDTGGLSQAGLGCEATGRDRRLQGVVVALVLVGVGLGERRQRAVEAVALAEIARDRDRVAGAGVRLRERVPAQLRVSVIVCGFIVSTMAEPLPSQSWRM